MAERYPLSRETWSFGKAERSRGQERWGMILAGGDGVRLRSLTRRIMGDERPKQFCRIFGEKTLLEQTTRRTAITVSPDRTLVAVTRAHEAFYTPLLSHTPSRYVVVQPENRGTAPAILYSLLRIAAAAPTGSVGIFPSDHYVSNDGAFMVHVEAAFEALDKRPELVILLGINPESPEVEYGWIEPADPVLGGNGQPLFRVRRFWEKPPLALARTLLAAGCLWNSFVIVARVPALLTLIENTIPDLYQAFDGARSTLNTLGEVEAIRKLYSQIPSSNFSQEVLAAHPANLAVLPVRGVSWSDLGEPNRVMVSLARIGVQPEWASLKVTHSAA